MRQQGLIDEHGDVELRQSTGVTVDEDEESSTQDRFKTVLFLI